jgi:hypothetical protein
MGRSSGLFSETISKGQLNDRVREARFTHFPCNWQQQEIAEDSLGSTTNKVDMRDGGNVYFL